jgi:hypothetical protein
VIRVLAWTAVIAAFWGVFGAVVFWLVGRVVKLAKERGGRS